MILKQEKVSGWGTPRPEYKDVLKHPSRRVIPGMTRISVAVALGPKWGRVKDSEGHEG